MCVVCVRATQSILAHERMLSLPVQAKDSVDVIGFVDVLDVLTHIVRLCSEGKTHPEADEAFECAFSSHHQLTHRPAFLAFLTLSRLTTGIPS